jgi:hypothetical protein
VSTLSPLSRPTAARRTQTDTKDKSGQEDPEQTKWARAGSHL